MNIKKFEARTMKEALEMVKSQLGPDAVILSAKDVTKGFGLGGIKSIEITAAYSDIVLKQKQFAQSKMSQKTQDKFNLINAKNQKEVIQKMMQQQIAKSQPVKSTSSSRRYIEIDPENLPITKSISEVKKSLNQQNQLTELAVNTWQNMDVEKLKNEVESLKKIVQDFKSIPQNFVQSHPGAKFGVNYDLCSQFQKLTFKGIDQELTGQLLVEVQKEASIAEIKNSKKVENYIMHQLAHRIGIAPNSENQLAKYQFFFGPSSSGKTTALIKLAAHLGNQSQKKIAVVSTDTIKFAADDHMKMYCQLLEIPFIAIKSTNDWNKITPYLNSVDHVLVDFASLSLKNSSEKNYLEQVIPKAIVQNQSHLVLSCHLKDDEAMQLVENYSSYNVTDLIFTHLDEVNTFGIIYNTSVRSQLPLFAFSLGRKVPEDFEFATIERVLDLILEITKKTTIGELSI